MRIERHWWLFLILVFAVLVTTWLTFTTNAHSKPPVNAEQDALDAFATEVHLTNMDKMGHVSTKIYTPELTHHTSHNHTKLRSPAVTLYVTNQPPWDVTSELGELQNGTETVVLNKNVVLHQPKGNTNEEVTVQTEALTVYPDKKQAMTDLPITLSSTTANVSSIGMHANLDEGTLKLKANTRGKYEIPAG